LYQYGQNTFNSSPAALSAATYHNVIKAVMLNGATHTYLGNPLMESNGTTPWSRLAGKGTTPLPSGTTLGQFGGNQPNVHPGLDPQLGTGMLNVVSTLANYSAGRQTPGLVNPVGWDTQTVPTTAAANSIVDAYTINMPVSGLFSATLCWDDFVNSTNTGAGNTTVSGTTTFNRANLTDLDLYLFQSNAPGTNLLNNVDYSTSDIDNVEYLSDVLPLGIYQLDVVNAQYAPPQATPYGLAWAVPEPASMSLIAVGSLAMLSRRRRGKLKQA
jgi:hypothetical protein